MTNWKGLGTRSGCDLIEALSRNLLRRTGGNPPQKFNQYSCFVPFKIRTEFLYIVTTTLTRSVEKIMLTRPGYSANVCFMKHVSVSHAEKHLTVVSLSEFRAVIILEVSRVRHIKGIGWHDVPTKFHENL